MAEPRDPRSVAQLARSARSLRFPRDARQAAGSGRTSHALLRPMFDHDTDLISLADLVIYDGDELLVDGSDPSTFILCHTAADIHRALAGGREHNAGH